MWLSKKLSAYRAAEQESTAAYMGVTTIGGANACVMTRGEQRDLAVFAPGGVVWQPRAGDTVLVIKGGVGCQEHCGVAAETSPAAPEGMAPGELFLYSAGGASIHLKNDGSIALKGVVRLEGDLEVRGDVKLIGSTRVSGGLFINGLTCPACGV